MLYFRYRLFWKGRVTAGWNRCDGWADAVGVLKAKEKPRICPGLLLNDYVTSLLVRAIVFSAHFVLQFVEFESKREAECVR